MMFQKMIGGVVVATGLMVGAASPAFAQGATTTPVAEETTEETESITPVAEEADDNSDKTGLWGLLGLLGLSGLAGLMRRRDDTANPRTTTPGSTTVR